MKTKHRAAVIKEQITPGLSCAKKSAALTSTEWSRLRMQEIYSNKALHLDIKEKHRERQKLKAMEMAKIREEDSEEAEKYREKERVKKHKQQHAKKVVNMPMKRKIKTSKQHMKRQMKKELANTMNSSTDSPCLSSTLSEPERLYDSKAILGHLSPKSKHKVTCALKISKCP